MNFCFYPFKFWKLNSVLLEINLYVVVCTVSRIRFMIILLTFEFRITRMFFEKFLICAIHIINRISKSKFVYLFKPFIFFFKNLINIVVTTYLVYRFLFCFIKIFPISKRLIINKSTTTECFLNLYFLCFIWIKPIFE